MTFTLEDYICRLHTDSWYTWTDSSNKVYANLALASKMMNVAGISVGISSGANLVGALKLQRENFVGNVTTVLPDCGKKYLTTDLPKISLQQSFDDRPHIEILDIQEIF